MQEIITLEDYVERGYFGENVAEVNGMTKFWLRKVIAQERGEKFFWQDLKKISALMIHMKMIIDTPLFYI